MPLKTMLDKSVEEQELLQQGLTLLEKQHADTTKARDEDLAYIKEKISKLNKLKQDN